MKTDLIIIKEYCTQAHIEPDFIIRLGEEGLIDLSIVDDERYIDTAQLSAIERYTRWYYDLAVNVEGISVMQHLLERIDEMQTEIQQLKQRVRLLDDDLL